jgi:glycosyltransferase involved in cell wall biosynthesis
MQKVSLCIPYHDSPNTAFYLSRLLASIHDQTYKNYEVVLTKEGKFAENHNAAIKKSTGDIVKILQMDDYLYHEGALQKIVDAFTPETYWLSSGCLHNNGTETFYPHAPIWNDDIYTGNNTLGSLSTLAMRRDSALLFEEPLTWVVDCDLYYRLYLKYGPPMLLNDYNVVIQLREDSETNTIPDAVKREEINYLTKKYGK